MLLGSLSISPLQVVLEFKAVYPGFCQMCRFAAQEYHVTKSTFTLAGMKKSQAMCRYAELPVSRGLCVLKWATCRWLAATQLTAPDRTRTALRGDH